MFKDLISRIAVALETAKASVKATSSVDGYLDHTDWSTFNGKQAALTNPVTLASSAPASAGAAGTKGQMYFDGTNMYLCTATNTWIKGTLTLATWS